MFRLLAFKQLPNVIRLAQLRVQSTGIHHMVVYVKTSDTYEIRMCRELRPAETFKWRSDHG